MIMEPMGGATEGYRRTEEKEKFKTGLKARLDSNALGKRTRDDEKEKEEEEEGSDSGSNAGDDAKAGDEAEAQEQPKPKKRKGPKGVNPLSMKKPKKRTATEPATNPLQQSSTDSTERPSSAAKSSDNSGPATAEAASESKKKRKRKPSSWKKAIIDKALALPAETAAG